MASIGGRRTRRSSTALAAPDYRATDEASLEKDLAEVDLWLQEQLATAQIEFYKIRDAVGEAEAKIVLAAMTRTFKDTAESRRRGLRVEFNRKRQIDKISDPDMREAARNIR